MKCPLFLVPVLVLLSSLAVSAQQTGEDPQAQQQEESSNDNVQDAEDLRRFWQASVSGGHYMVALDRISNISMQEYLLDGSLVVNEVTIDAGGRALARFYHIAPVTDAIGRDEVARATRRGREMIDRAADTAGTDVHNMAQKTYPTTTHAGMLEYRILDREDLDALYSSLRKAWESGKGRKFTIK
jgi:hypothetical protein